MTSEHISYGAYLSPIDTSSSFGNIRIGQAYMNRLSAMRPDLHEKLIGSPNDPFYDDGRLPEFFKFLEAHWEKEQ